MFVLSASTARASCYTFTSAALGDVELLKGFRLRRKHGSAVTPLNWERAFVDVGDTPFLVEEAGGGGGPPPGELSRRHRLLADSENKLCSLD